MIENNKWAMLLASAVFSLMANTYADETYTWDSVAIGGGGFVSGLVASKTEQGLMYARTDVGGAYRWDKTAARWIPLTDWVSENEMGYMGIEAIALDPNASAKVYMLAGTSYFNGGKTAILKSNDYGKNFSVVDVTSQFKAHGNGMGRNTGEKLQVDSANGNILYVGTRANGIFKSTDAGQTWARLNGLNVTTTPSGNGVSFVVLDPTSISGSATQKLFVGITRYGTVGDNFYVSADAGQTFIPVAGAPTTLMPQRAVIAGGNVIITYANGAGPWGDTSVNEGMDSGQVWKYNIGMGTWTNITPAGFSRAFSGITVDPNNSNHMIVSSINTYYLQYGSVYGDRIFSTSDGGTTWVDVVARGFSLDANGVSWIAGNSIHWAASVEFDPFDTKSVSVVSGNGIFKTSNIDATPTVWAFHVAGLEETVPLNIVSVANGPVISTIGDYDGFRHTDVSQYGSINAPTMGSTSGLDVAALNTNVAARVGTSMYVSNDTGVSWTKTAALNGGNGQVAIAADGKVILHSPKDSTLSYYSTNSGASWGTISGLAVKNARPIADSVNAKKFYALASNTMMVSTDAGISFAAAGLLTSANGSNIIRVAPGKEGDIWVALYEGGLAHSINSGATFANLPNVTYAAAVGFGKAAAGANYPTLYIWGTVNGVRGLFRSIDTGATWVRVNDSVHQYGGPGNGQFVAGDMNTFGVVYMSTVGRGIVYGKPSAATSNSSSVTSLASSSSVSSISSVAGTSSSANSVNSQSSSSISSAATSSSSISSAAPVSNGNTSGGGKGGGYINVFTLLLLLCVNLAALKKRKLFF